MNEQWKRIVYLVAAIQVGFGIIIIGVLSFIPLFLGDLGIHNEGDAAFWAGLISGVTPLMITFSAPYWTIEANRRGPKKIMMLVLACLVISVGLASIVTTPWQLFGLRMIQGLVGGFVPIGLAIIVTVTPEEYTSWAMGLFQASMVMGLVFGPLMGGIAADLMGYRAPFILFSSVAFFCLLGVYFFLPQIEIANKLDKKESQFTMIRYFLGIPRVRLLVFIQFLCNFGITGIGPILPLYIKHYMNINGDILASVVGFIIFLAGLCSALASLSVSRVTKRFGMPTILTTATIGVGTFFIIQYIMPDIWGLGLFRALAGFSMGFIMPIANTVISQSVPADKRSIVFGIVSALAILGNVAGPVISGMLAAEFGFGSVFWVTAIVFYMAAFMIYQNLTMDGESK